MKILKFRKQAKSSGILMASGDKLKGLFKCQILKVTHPNFTFGFKYLSEITNHNSSTLVFRKDCPKKIFTRVTLWLRQVSSLALDPLFKNKQFSLKARRTSMMKNLGNKRTLRPCITIFSEKKSKLLTISP